MCDNTVKYLNFVQILKLIDLLSLMGRIPRGTLNESAMTTPEHPETKNRRTVHFNAIPERSFCTIMDKAALLKFISDISGSKKAAGESSKPRWTDAENELLKSLVKSQGHAWSRFRRDHFANSSDDGKIHQRSDMAIKLQWSKLASEGLSCFGF